MHLLVEEFLKDNLEFKLDVLETLENHREEFIDWRPNWKLMQFLIDQLFPSKSSSYKSVQVTTWLGLGLGLGLGLVGHLVGLPRELARRADDQAEGTLAWAGSGGES